MPCATAPFHLEVADILRAHGEAYRLQHPVSPEQAAVMRRLVACRTAALGGHVDSCDACGFARISYNSCRDRHCPKCQSTKRAEWLEQRFQRLLPVDYFHVVFTLPEGLKPLALKNRRVVYDLLFRAASEALLQLAADPRRLGAQVGFTAILHTWGQNLLFHPHLHCVVTGGGLSPGGDRWVSARQGFLLPVKVLGKLFRGKFLAGLKKLWQSGTLQPTGRREPSAHRRAFRQLLDDLYRQNWVVYAKPPFGGAEHVYRYLGRYTHRVAISNSRLLAMEDGRVRFRYKDYADENRTKEMALSVEEFIRRFLMHVLPKGFVRIRHYGLLAGRNAVTKLARCRELLGASPVQAPPERKTWADRVAEWTGQNPLECPHCRKPLVRRSFGNTEAFVPVTTDSKVLVPVAVLDSS